MKIIFLSIVLCEIVYFSKTQINVDVRLNCVVVIHLAICRQIPVIGNIASFHKLEYNQ